MKKNNLQKFQIPLFIRLKNLFLFIFVFLISSFIIFGLLLGPFGEKYFPKFSKLIIPENIGILMGLGWIFLTPIFWSFYKKSSTLIKTVKNLESIITNIRLKNIIFSPILVVSALDENFFIKRISLKGRYYLIWTETPSISKSVLQKWIDKGLLEEIKFFNKIDQLFSGKNEAVFSKKSYRFNKKELYNNVSGLKEIKIGRVKNSYRFLAVANILNINTLNTLKKFKRSMNLK